MFLYVKLVTGYAFMPIKRKRRGTKMGKLNRYELHNLLEIIGEGIIITDPNLRILHFNTASREMFGLTAADIGQPLFDTVRISDYDSLKKDIREFKNSQTEIKREISTTDDRWFTLRLHPHRDEKDKIKGIAFVFSEITTYKSIKNRFATRIRQQKILSELGLYALTRNNPRDIIRRSLQITCLALRIDYSLLLEHDGEQGILKLVDYAALDENGPEVREIEIDSEFDIAAAFDREKSLTIRDFQKEKKYKPFPFTGNQQLTSSVNVRVEGCDRPYGVLCAYTKEKRKFTEFHRCFLQVVANIISESRERALKEAALGKEAAQSKKYQKEILHNSIVERWNIGGYLHDTLAQILTAVKIKIAHLKKQTRDKNPDLYSEFSSLTKKIDKAISGVRDLTHEVIPVDIEQEGIEHAFRLLMRGLQKRHNLKCSLQTGEVIEKVKSKTVASNLYHIIQEAIKNAAIHGEANNVDVILTEEDNHLKLQIIDDGIGLSKTKPRKGTGSGTNIMKHRIELLGGSFKIEEITETGKTGTVVTLLLPVKYLAKPPEEME